MPSEIGFSYQDELSRIAKECERLLAELVPMGDPDTDPIVSAMRYSLLSGGKRIRPYLAYAFSRACGGKGDLALRFGCALEMIHTYSLIHDDLPAMDNDDLRRGKPTCHRAFGEANAILAGDALNTLAFAVIAESDADGRQVREAVKLLAEAAGYRGMIGGQGMDLFAEGRTLSREQLSKLQALKTGALISAACRLGCIAARVYEGDAYTAAELYAEKLGLAFQVVDDLLDATGSEERLGKPIGSDERSHKATFYTLLGEEGARQYAARLTEEAALAVKALPESQRLIDLAESLLSRDH